MPVLHEGQKIGSYEIKGLLGTGGMSEVYLGVHTTLERRVAIKVLNPAFNSDPTFPLRFRREAKAIARLNHPNIITVYDFGEQGDLAYLVMELATDGSFDRRAAALTTLGELVAELTPICEGLHFAHGQGIVHRDLKPENILITKPERKLLADFGLARIRTETLVLSVNGSVLGTPHYMAPEQLLGEDVDQRADVYAFGVMLYQLLTGDVPYNGRSFFAIAQRHLKSPVPSLRAALPDAPVELEAIVTRAMAKQREDRYESVAALLADLKRVGAAAAALPVGKAAVADARARPLPMPAQTESEADGDTELCGHCARAFRAGDRFCRGCGARRDEAVALAEAPLGSPASAPLTMHSRIHHQRRPTSLSVAQRVALGAASVLSLAISLTGFWLWHQGRAAGVDAPLSGATTFIYDHLRAFKSGLTVLALIGACYSVVAMRLAILNPRRLSPDVYRRLRQTHRLAGYLTALTAIGVGVLLCIGLFGFRFGSLRVAAHTVFGSLLLATLVLKVLTVRWLNPLRGRLDIIGLTILALFIAVFLTSTVQYVYEVLAGSEGGYDLYP